MAGPPPSAKINFVEGQGQNPLTSFYLHDYLGEARGSVFEVTNKLRRLPDNPCKYVMLANWNTGEDIAFSYEAVSGDGLYENNGGEIYYGFDGVIVAQLFPSQNSGLIPVNNTNLIVLGTRPGETRKLWYAWFW